MKTDQDQTQPRQEVLQDLQNPGPDPGQNPDQEVVRESQDRGQGVVRESQVVQNHDLEVVQDKVALPEVDQVHYLNLFIVFFLFFFILREIELSDPRVTAVRTS